MIVNGVDPGPTHSAIVTYDDEAERVWVAKHADNESVLAILGGDPLTNETVAIESTSYYGKDFSVGKTIMDTCIAIGRFQQFAIMNNMPVLLIPRIKVRSAICGHSRVGDAQVRTAIIDRFGGSRAVAVGTKKKPGPLYGVSGHCWSALAVALTALETAHKEATA